MKRVFLDAGHGGKDIGGTGHYLLEKDITLQIALLVEEYLKSDFDGFIIKQSRTSDTTILVEQRTEMAKTWRADVFVSIHCNNGDGNGYEDYAYPNRKGDTAVFHDIMHKHMTTFYAARNIRDNGKKYANLCTLREATCPSITTANLFMDHVEIEYFHDSDFLHGVARAHAYAIAEFFGFTPITVQPPLKQWYRALSDEFTSEESVQIYVEKLKEASFYATMEIIEK